MPRCAPLDARLTSAPRCSACRAARNAANCCARTSRSGSSALTFSTIVRASAGSLNARCCVTLTPRSVTPPARTTSAAPSCSAGMMSVSGRRSSSTSRVVPSARTINSGATSTRAEIPSVPAMVRRMSDGATSPGHAARIITTPARASSTPVKRATAASAALSSSIDPKMSRRDPPTERATITSPLRAAVRARCSASSVAAPTVSVSSTAPRTIPVSFSSASCCSCGQTIARPPQSASSAAVSPSASVSAGAAAVPPRTVSAGSAPASVSAAVSATSVPVPACHCSASRAALRLATAGLMCARDAGARRNSCVRASSERRLDARVRRGHVLQSHPALCHEPVLIVADPRFPELVRATARNRPRDGTQLSAARGADE